MESLERYKKLTQSLISKINNKFSMVTFLTIDEIIRDEELLFNEALNISLFKSDT